jgi:hypothetical protein
MPIANFDLAGQLYSEFLFKYSEPHDYKGKRYKHHIPSSFVYRLIKGNCVWLLTLIMGVAGYNMYFDDDSEASQVLTLEKLNAAGVTDPVLKYDSKITPWEGKISSGKQALDPVKRPSTGLGICHYQAPTLKKFYTAKTLTAKLPLIDSEGKIIEEDGKRKSSTFTLYCNKKPVRGWGMSYGSKRLQITDVVVDPDGLSYKEDKDRILLQGSEKLLKSKSWKYIGGKELIRFAKQCGAIISDSLHLGSKQRCELGFNFGYGIKFSHKYFI